VRQLVHVAEPLKRVLRTVGDFGPADKTFEQTDARREDLLFLSGGTFARDTYAGQARVGRRPVALSRASPGCADGYERGSSRPRT
jgi:hypothetical protein